MDPAHPLLARPQRPAGEKIKHRQHAAEHAAVAREHYARPHDRDAHARRDLRAGHGGRRPWAAWLGAGACWANLARANVGKAASTLQPAAGMSNLSISQPHSASLGRAGTTLQSSRPRHRLPLHAAPLFGRTAPTHLLRRRLPLLAHARQIVAPRGAVLCEAARRRCAVVTAGQGFANKKWRRRRAPASPGPSLEPQTAARPCEAAGFAPRAGCRPVCGPLAPAPPNHSPDGAGRHKHARPLRLGRRRDRLLRAERGVEGGARSGTRRWCLAQGMQGPLSVGPPLRGKRRRRRTAILFVTSRRDALIWRLISGVHLARRGVGWGYACCRSAAERAARRNKGLHQLTAEPSPTAAVAAFSSLHT